MTGSEYSSSTAASSDCRYERALRLAEARLAKAARSPAAKLEAHLHCEALQAKHEAKERARQEWLESFSMEKSAEFQETNLMLTVVGWSKPTASTGRSRRSCWLLHKPRLWHRRPKRRPLRSSGQRRRPSTGSLAPKETRAS
ncbi:unnamed protein product [Effrenium voratum]|nr:unnamed protein product [Effrenium voratum]